MAKRGRPKKTCNRQPNGQPSRRVADVIPHEVLMQRAAAVGVKLTEDRVATMRGQLAGTALGVLRVRAHEGKPGLDERQYRAGESLAALWRQWAAAHGIPPRVPLQGGGGVGREFSEEQRRRLDSEWRGIRNSVYALPAGVPAWRMIERICMDDAIPDAMSGSLMDAVQRALDTVAKHFRIPAGLVAA